MKKENAILILRIRKSHVTYWLALFSVSNGDI